VEEATTEAAAVVVIITAIAADAAEAEDGDTVTNLTTTIEAVIITTMVVEAEDVLEIDLVPVHLPSKILKQPFSARYLPLLAEWESLKTFASPNLLPKDNKDSSFAQWKRPRLEISMI
jgi:hypothetical protein